MCFSAVNFILNNYKLNLLEKEKTARKRKRERERTYFEC